MFTFKDENPTKMYLEALDTLLEQGEECCPRGKLIKELRPTSVEFQNPYNRVTFLGSRRVNPFFQLAESLWILSGRADVEWLTKFNANMASFSDDGVYFNAPYGERIRSWNKNSAHGIIINPIDQLVDAYKKLSHDKDTRQAVVLISNPMFDNSNYTIGEMGKDIACLTGDTMISSPEGDISIKELCKKENYPVYSFNETTGEVEIKKVLTGGLTRRNSKIMKITLGDGTEIKATNDHKFYRKKYKTTMEKNKNNDGVHPVNTFVGMELVDCEQLKIGDTLPFLLRYEEAQGYRNVNINKLSKSISKGKKEHIMYMEYLLGRELEESEIVHHKNHVRNQNFADNLELLEKGYHDSLDKEGNLFPSGSKKNWTSKELLTKENLLNVAIDLIKSGKDLTVSTFQSGFDGVGCLSACKREYGTFKNLKELAYETLGLKVPNGLSGSKGNWNATKIVKIEYLEELEDVYDITVEDNHNFFANGYLVHNCNLIFTFKIRKNRLYMTVFNRSNDAHWGLWGANLCQFSTIQEVMLTWLKNSGNSEFASLELGEYCQVTDSLHIYLDEYGAKCTTDVINYYKEHDKDEVLADFTCKEEPRMNSSIGEFERFLNTYWSTINPFLMDDSYIQNSKNIDILYELMESIYSSNGIDDYWFFAIRGMLVYRLVKLGNLKEAVQFLSKLPSCQWKISMMYFLKTFIHKFGRDENNAKDYSEIVQIYSDNVFEISQDLVNSDYVNNLRAYLKL